jgi:hypothetical protein
VADESLVELSLESAFRFSALPLQYGTLAATDVLTAR